MSESNFTFPHADPELDYGQREEQSFMDLIDKYSPKSISQTWERDKEAFESCQWSREHYIEVCKRRKASLSRLLEEQVIHRAEMKPIYKREQYRNTIPFLIEHFESFIAKYQEAIDRESMLLPQEKPLEIHAIQSGESDRLQEVGKKVVEGGRKGAEIASHNSEKNRRRDQVLKRYGEIMKESHKMSETEVKKQLTKEFRVSRSTIYRYLQDR